MTRDSAIQDLQTALAAPFDPRDVKFKPQMVKANRCLAMPYIDARHVQDRLDAVLGVENWQDSYSILPDGSVVCILRCNLGGRWVRKTDVGSPSEQPDGGDRLKAAFSDALKRAAVKFGIGRYLYRLPATWCDYDPVKKQIAQVPQLPAWALPASVAPAKPAPAPTAPKPAPAPVKSLFQQHAEAIDATKDVPSLQAVLGKIGEDFNAGRITSEELRALGERKEAHKLKYGIGKPQPTQAGK